MGRCRVDPYGGVRAGSSSSRSSSSSSSRSRRSRRSKRGKSFSRSPRRCPPSSPPARFKNRIRSRRHKSGLDRPGRSRSRSEPRRNRKSRGDDERQRRSPSARGDRRPAVEREKSGVKLFVGRLPREISQRHLRECFEEFGEVVETFVIDSKAISNVGCAFIRMARLEDAEKAIHELHEQRVLNTDHRRLGPMQVAFARGEANRLGLDEEDETLPTYKEARKKVVEHKEKRQYFEDMKRQQAKAQKELERQYEQAHKAMIQNQTFQKEIAERLSKLDIDELSGLVKDGQRNGGQKFRNSWQVYCESGWAGTRSRHDPSRHTRESLGQFLVSASFEHGREPWFRRRFDDDFPKLPEEISLPPAPFGFGMPLPPFVPGVALPPPPPPPSMLPPVMIPPSKPPRNGEAPRPPPGMIGAIPSGDGRAPLRRGPPTSTSKDPVTSRKENNDNKTTSKGDASIGEAMIMDPPGRFSSFLAIDGMALPRDLGGVIGSTLDGRAPPVALVEKIKDVSSTASAEFVPSTVSIPSMKDVCSSAVDGIVPLVVSTEKTDDISIVSPQGFAPPAAPAEKPKDDSSAALDGVVSLAVSTEKTDDVCIAAYHALVQPAPLTETKKTFSAALDGFALPAALAEKTDGVIGKAQDGPPPEKIDVVYSVETNELDPPATRAEKTTDVSDTTGERVPPVVAAEKAKKIYSTIAPALSQPDPASGKALLSQQVPSLFVPRQLLDYTDVDVLSLGSDSSSEDDTRHRRRDDAKHRRRDDSRHR